MKIGIVGVGVTPFRLTTPEFSWKELMYDAAQRAYADAGVDPRTDVDSFITCAEDYYEGFGIFDEFTPDQLGAALRPMHTVGGGGLHGPAAAVPRNQHAGGPRGAAPGRRRASGCQSAGARRPLEDQAQ